MNNGESDSAVNSLPDLQIMLPVRRMAITLQNTRKRMHKQRDNRVCGNIRNLDSSQYLLC